MSSQAQVTILGQQIHSYENRPDPSPHLKSLLERQLSNVNVRITSTRDETIEIADELEIVITSTISKEVLEAAKNLKWIQTLSVGVSDFDLDALRSRGIILTNASGVKSESIAEQVIAQMIMFERLLPALENERSRRWAKYEGGEIYGETLGIVGVGSIGGRLAELGKAFNMSVVGTKRNTNTVNNAVDNVYSPSEIDEVLTRADYLAITCPLTEETRGMITAEEIAQMKPSAILLNVGRGPVVDEDALTRALIDGDLRGAALDVFEEEPLPRDSLLWVLPNVLVTPHMAGSTRRKWERSADLFVSNYQLFQEGKSDSLENLVI